HRLCPDGDAANAGAAEIGADGPQRFEAAGGDTKMKNFSSSHSDLTEMTELKEGRSPDCPGGLETAAPWTNKPIPSGWILYDGQCRHCVAAAQQFERWFARRGFHFLPLQTPWIQERLGLDPGAPLEEMRVLTKDGHDIGGADAVIFLAQRTWWSR